MPAEIHREGDSKEVLSAFPSDVKKNFGYNLRRLQNGLQPVCDVRSLPSIGKGVYELKDADERAWYRVMLPVKDRQCHLRPSLLREGKPKNWPARHQHCTRATESGSTTDTGGKHEKRRE